jgi:glycosyltransferase involved in cell wall biosynthesis
MKKKLKITIVLPFAGLAGGIRVLATYAEKLLQKGHTVRLVSQPPARIPVRRQIKSLLSCRRLIDGPQPGPYLDNLKEYHRVLARAGPIMASDVPDADIIVATFWPTAFWIADLPANKGKKVYFIQGHEVEPVFTGSNAEQTYLLDMHKITISQILVDILAQKYGQTNVTLVKNSVDTKQFFGTAREKNRAPTIGTLFSTSPYKGTEIVFRAIQLMRSSYPNLRLISFGADRPTENLPIPDFCDFSYRPKQSDLRSLYNSCDVWVCGSYSEGFHLPPLEAMACRCPVVSTRVGGPLDIIKPGINGYLVDIGDAIGLSNGISAVLGKTDAQWKKMSDASYETARSYSWDDATDLIEREFLRIVNSV